VPGPYTAQLSTVPATPAAAKPSASMAPVSGVVQSHAVPAGGGRGSVLKGQMMQIEASAEPLEPLLKRVFAQVMQRC
jgi:hypothetical protein